MQVGETVICINNKTSKTSKDKVNLTINKSYIIKDIVFKIGDKLQILGDNNEYSYYRINRFITLNEYRDNQLNKIIW